MRDVPKGFKGRLFVIFSLFVALTLGSYLLAWLLVSGDRAGQKEYSSGTFVVALIVGAMAWTLANKLIVGATAWTLAKKSKKAESPKCPQCLGVLNEEATKCVNCGSDISG